MEDASGKKPQKATFCGGDESHWMKAIFAEVKTMSDMKFWIAFGAGVGVGVAAAVYGPKAAKTTRKQLNAGLDSARDYVDSTGKVIKKAADRYSRQAEDVLHDATRTVKTAVDRASGAVKSVSDLVA
jgi:hypothetical protein